MNFPSLRSRDLDTGNPIFRVVTSITSKPNRWEPEQERRLYYPVGKDRKQLHKVHQLGDKTYLHHKVEHRD